MYLYTFQFDATTIIRIIIITFVGREFSFFIITIALYKLFYYIRTRHTNFPFTDNKVLLYCILLYYNVLYCIVLYCIMYCIVLYCIIL